MNPRKEKTKRCLSTFNSGFHLKNGCLPVPPRAEVKRKRLPRNTSSKKTKQDLPSAKTVTEKAEQKTHTVPRKIMGSSTTCLNSRVQVRDVKLYQERTVENLKTTLMEAAEERDVCVIIDNVYDGPEFGQLCENLRSVPNLTIWAAARKPISVPSSVIQWPLTGSFRLPLPVQQQRKQANSTGPTTRSQTAARYIRRLLHDGPGHTAKEPKDCEPCGRSVARILAEWDVGDRPGSAYHYRDVFVLVRGDAEPFDEKHDKKGKVLRQAMGVVRGLRHARIPVRVVERDDNEALSQLAANRGPDEVSVVAEHVVQGLERRMIVWVGVGTGDYYDICDKWNATSCTMDRIIWLQAPGDVDLDNEDEICDNVSDDDVSAANDEDDV